MLKHSWFYDASKDGTSGSTTTPDAATNTATSPAGDDKKFTQSDVDRIVQERLQREREAQKTKDEEIKRQADADAAKKNGEWEKVATQREIDLKRLQGESRDKDIKLAAMKLGLKDPDYGVFLVTRAGEGANPEQVLGDYIKTNPEAITALANPANPNLANPNPTNPVTNNNQFFTRSQLKDPTFYAANKDAIMQAAREGRIKEE